MIVRRDAIQSGSKVVYFLSSLRTQTKKHQSAQKVGFPPISERAPKSAQRRTFCIKSAQQEVRFCALCFVQINVFAGWLRNRTGTGNRNRRNRFSRNRKWNRNRRNRFPGTETGTGGPSFPVKLCWNREKPFLQRNRRNRKPEPLEPFHPQTVTEPNRTGASLPKSNAKCDFTTGQSPFWVTFQLTSHFGGFFQGHLG